MEGIIVIFFIKDNKYHLMWLRLVNNLITQINQIIPMINKKMVVNFSSNKGKNNDNSSNQINRLHNSLIISIVNTPEKYLSNFDGKSDTIKVSAYSVNSSSTLCSYSIGAMYNTSWDNQETVKSFHVD